MEEALWMPKWSNTNKKYSRVSSTKEFYFALIFITILAYITTFLYGLYQFNGVIKYIFYGFVGAMLLNAIIPHIFLTILTKNYCPGVLTGGFLNLPCFSILIVYSIKINAIELQEVIVSTGIISIVLLAILPILFRIGRKVINF